jgi:hypothetical protein
VAFPSVIQLDPDSVICTSQLIRVKFSTGHRVVLQFSEGKQIEYPFDTELEQRIFYNYVVGLLDANVITPVIYSVDPPYMESGTDPVLVIRGKNFSTTATITLTIEGTTGGSFTGTPSGVSSTALSISASALNDGVNALNALAPTVTPYVFKIRYSDSDGGISSWLFEDANYAFTIYPIGGGSNVNPVVFDTVYSDPTTATYTPTNTLLGCFWFGVGGTFYSWNPDTTSWVGIITL